MHDASKHCGDWYECWADHTRKIAMTAPDGPDCHRHHHIGLVTGGAPYASDLGRAPEQTGGGRTSAVGASPHPSRHVRSWSPSIFDLGCLRLSAKGSWKCAQTGKRHRRGFRGPQDRGPVKCFRAGTRNGCSFGLLGFHHVVVDSAHHLGMVLVIPALK